MITKPKARWMEIAVRTDGAATRAVANLFDRYGEGGSVTEVAIGRGTPVAPGPSGAVVRAYLPVNGKGRGRLATLRAELARVRKRTPFPVPTLRRLSDDDWSEGWKKDYRPVRIGSRVLILPSWMRRPRRGNEILIRLDPGLAFGSGLHPTTRLCLEALLRTVRRKCRVLDVGTGSGILAIAARKLGAGRATGLDNDPDAVSAARRNGALNGIGRGLEFRAGTIGRNRYRGMDVIVVNILARTIRKMAPDLAAALGGDGVLIASGLLAEQAAEVTRALREAGLRVRERRQRKGWAALLAVRGDAPSGTGARRSARRRK